MRSATKISRNLLIAVLILIPTITSAQFEAADAKLFVDWPQLQVDSGSGGVPETVIYAVIDDPLALYTIAVYNRFGPAVLGVFQCNREFTVLKSRSNGFYDIRCVNQEITKNPSTSILKFGENFRYNQKF